MKVMISSRKVFLTILLIAITFVIQFILIYQFQTNSVINHPSSSIEKILTTSPQISNISYEKKVNNDTDDFALMEFHKRAGNIEEQGTYIIPHRTIFVHTLHKEPKEMDKALYYNVLNSHKKYSELWIANNDKQSPPMWFLSEDDCLMAIQLVEPQLIPYYVNEERGNNKANVCRVAALYLKGGYYFDVDMVVVKPLLLASNITFATPAEYRNNEQTDLQGLFNSFLASAPKHPILRTNLDLFLQHYRKGDLPLRSKTHHMGTGTLRLAYEQTPVEQRGETFMNLIENAMTEINEKRYFNFLRTGKGWGCTYFVEDPQQKQMYFWSRLIRHSSPCEPVSFWKNLKHKIKLHNKYSLWIQNSNILEPFVHIHFS